MQIQRRGLAAVASLLGAAVLCVGAVALNNATRSSGASSVAPSIGLSTGTIAPVVAVPAVQSGRPAVDSKTWQGEPVVVNFFASWCHPCKQELPLLTSAWHRLGSRVRFVGIDVNDSTANALRLLKADGVGYAIGADPHDAVTLRYGLVGLPTTIFLTAQGRVAGTHSGALTAASLDGWLRRLTATRSS